MEETEYEIHLTIRLEDDPQTRPHARKIGPKGARHRRNIERAVVRAIEHATDNDIAGTEILSQPASGITARIMRESRTN